MLDLIAIVAFPLGLIALPFAFYKFRSQPIQSVLLFALPVLIFFGACDLSEAIVQAQTLADFDLLKEDYQICVDGKRHPNPHEALSALKTLRWIPQHHSYPTKRIKVEVSDPSRQVVLVIVRDSRNPREYWVFCPKSFITRYKEIGRIVTSTFDSY